MASLVESRLPVPGRGIADKFDPVCNVIRANSALSLEIKDFCKCLRSLFIFTQKHVEPSEYKEHVALMKGSRRIVQNVRPVLQCLFISLCAKKNDSAKKDNLSQAWVFGIVAYDFRENFKSPFISTIVKIDIPNFPPHISKLANMSVLDCILVCLLRVEQEFVPFAAQANLPAHKVRLTHASPHAAIVASQARSSQ